MRLKKKCKHLNGVETATGKCITCRARVDGRIRARLLGKHAGMMGLWIKEMEKVVLDAMERYGGPTLNPYIGAKKSGFIWATWERLGVDFTNKMTQGMEFKESDGKPGGPLLEICAYNYGLLLMLWALYVEERRARERGHVLDHTWQAAMAHLEKNARKIAHELAVKEAKVNIAAAKAQEKKVLIEPSDKGEKERRKKLR